MSSPPWPDSVSRPLLTQSSDWEMHDTVPTSNTPGNAQVEPMPQPTRQAAARREPKAIPNTVTAVRNGRAPSSMASSSGLLPTLGLLTANGNLVPPLPSRLSNQGMRMSVGSAHAPGSSSSMPSSLPCIGNFGIPLRGELSPAAAPVPPTLSINISGTASMDLDSPIPPTAPHIPNPPGPTTPGRPPNLPLPLPPPPSPSKRFPQYSILRLPTTPKSPSKRSDLPPPTILPEFAPDRPKRKRSAANLRPYTVTAQAIELLASPGKRVPRSPRKKVKVSEGAEGRKAAIKGAGRRAKAGALGFQGPRKLDFGGLLRVGGVEDGESAGGAIASAPSRNANASAGLSRLNAAAGPSMVARSEANRAFVPVNEETHSMDVAFLDDGDHRVI
ncbi:hypothetical protein D9611_000987 [Ephemerocybe angulata]|uniref:Uncharacterized protein n=1 Tax=Ephemerocybe angulata TaxID=980116 RepID=A0A8H5BN99_9AGAR|nr:hypothetical protein D9611_000987 [Tulosesus angulatus]